MNYSTHVFREYLFVGINFVPFSYRPQSGQLKLMEQVTISANYTADPGNNLESSPPTPADKMTRRCEYSGGQQIQLSGSFNIFPVQPPQTFEYLTLLPFVGQNPVKYHSNTPFPEEPLLTYSTHIYREYSYVDISFILVFHKKVLIL